jgi:hypothetical protein
MSSSALAAVDEKVRVHVSSAKLDPELPSPPLSLLFCNGWAGRWTAGLARKRLFLPMEGLLGLWDTLSWLGTALFWLREEPFLLSEKRFLLAGATL